MHPTRHQRGAFVFLTSLLGAICPAPATAHGPSDVLHDAVQTGVEATDAHELDVDESPTTESTDDFDTFVKRQASLEVQVGLRLYEEFDDYRAITALTRYRLLDGTARARFLSNLMIGQIYHRNDRPELAITSFEAALAAAPSPYHQTFTYLLALQEACLAMSLYVECRSRLGRLNGAELQPEVAELVAYQTLYTDVVLRSDSVSTERARTLRDERLRMKAFSLVARDRAFDELPTRSPALAGVLSAVLPGSGQLYNGRPVDALLAFLINGALGSATYLAFAKLESIPVGVVSGIVTAGFYAGNIVNAVTDARQRNASLYRDFFEELGRSHWPRVAFRVDGEQVLFSYGFDWPGPKYGDTVEEPTNE